MSFILRTVTERAGGGEIVREIRIDKDGLLIGRGNDCDVQIPDLAVMLHHAALRRVENMLEIEAVGDADLQIEGTSIPRRRFDPSQPLAVLFGAHRLQIARGEDGTVVLTLERIGALSDAADLKDEARVFSLEGTRLGKRSLAWALTLLVIGLFVVWPVAAFLMRDKTPVTVETMGSQARIADISWSSGPLSKAHANLENQCTACHQQPFVAVRDSACQTCHTGAHDHAEADRLRIAEMHGGLWEGANAKLAAAFNLPEGRCTTCHVEHEGDKGIVNFAPTLCADCHNGMSKRLTDTDLRDASDFTRDHPDFRPAIVTAPSFDTPQIRRIALSDKPAENSGLKFPHDLHLSRTNAVARMAETLGTSGGYGAPLDCASCHRPDPTGVRFTGIEMERDCGTCHSLAFAREDGVVRTLRHGDAAQAAAELRDFLTLRGPAAAPLDLRRPGEGFAGRAALLTQGARANFGKSVNDRIRSIFQPGGACYDCHTVEPPSRAGGLDFRIAPVSLPSRYFDRALFSHADHDTKVTECSTCHLAPTSKAASDVLMPGIAVCRDCHVGAQPQKGKVASDCGSCHEYHDSSPLPLKIPRGARAGAGARRGADKT